MDEEKNGVVVESPTAEEAQENNNENIEEISDEESSQLSEDGAEVDASLASEETFTTGSGKELPTVKVEEIVQRRVNETKAAYEARIAQIQAQYQQDLCIADQLTSDWEGETLADRLLAKQAYDEGTDFQTLKVKQMQEQARIASLVQNHPLVRQSAEIARQAETLKYQKMMDDDFTAIKAAYPTLPAKDLNEVIAQVGEDFLRLRLDGKVDAVTAYQTLLTKKARSEKPMPASAGQIVDISNDNEFFTAEEMEKLDPAVVANDEKLYKKFRKSLAKLNL